MARATEWSEAAQRQHRQVAIFAMIQCWQRCLDGIVIDGDDLKRLLGLQSLDPGRRVKIGEDFREFFPFQKEIPLDNGTAGQLSFYLSRKKFERFLPSGVLPDEKRIEGIVRNGGPRLGIFKIWPFPTELHVGFRAGEHQALAPFFGEYANYDERLLAAQLSLLIQGFVSVNSLPWLSAEQGESQSAR